MSFKILDKNNNIIKNQKGRFTESTNGITLISLVVTIVVLLILAGVSINLVLGNNGIIKKAKEAKEQTEIVQLKEKLELSMTNINILYYKDENDSNSNDKTNYYSNKEIFLDNSLIKNEYELIDYEFYDTGKISGKIRANSNNMYYFSANIENCEVKVVNVKDNDLLLENELLQIGQYVNYPIRYKDAYINKLYTNSGWRIIDTGRLSNNSQSIQLISTGIPLKYNWKFSEWGSAMDTANSLRDFNSLKNIKFENNMNIWPLLDKNYASNIYVADLDILNFSNNSNIDYFDSFSGDLYALNDLDDLYSNEDIKIWLSSAINENQLRFIRTTGAVSYNYRGSAIQGIRIIITLDKTVKGNFDTETNIWNIY